ncbi:MAG: Exodeoxyribonuclease 7 large subunit [candidate division NC10 bacterium CSP1-5]|nr:MAG: Exodeoxyribonuclease 7 large subunit [candidate division NC10 bacterium CSP1-5]
MELRTPRIYSVSELTAELKALLENTFTGVWVEGEISNFKHHTSGHMYFTLKDERGQLRAVMFRGSNRGLQFRPEDGLAVIVFGNVTIYEPRGEYQVYVECMEPKGLGALQLAFEQLKTRLEAEGLFDPARKRPIPLLPKKIGVVTSPSGAAIRDILQIIHRRFANVQVLIFPVRVQGEGAAAEIVEGVEFLNKRGDLDVLIVARGGGSIEDLWAFNEEVVARAIYASQTPVISAVGHETDFTIADFVADVRAPTPSAAAELVISRKAELSQRVDDLFSRLVSHMRYRAERSGERLRSLERHLRLLSPLERVKGQRERLRDGALALQSSMSHRLALWRGELRTAAARLDSLSPLAILARGYSVCRRLPDLSILTRAASIAEGERVEVLLHQGGLICRVEEQRQ